MFNLSNSGVYRNLNPFQSGKRYTKADNRGRPEGRHMKDELKEIKRKLFEVSINSKGHPHDGALWEEVGQYIDPSIPIQSLRKYASISHDAGKVGAGRVELFEQKLSELSEMPLKGYVYDINKGYWTPRANQFDNIK